VGTDPEQLKHEIETTRRDLSADVDALTEKVHPRRVVQRRAGRARHRIVSLRERVMGTASDRVSSTGQGISSSVSGVGDAAGSAASAVADTAGSTGAAVRQRTEGNPLAAGVIAFGAGWLVSSLLPASEQEKRAASKVTDAARETAQPLAEQAGHALSEMTEAMRQPAQQAVQQVRSTAGDAAGTVQDQARSSASEVAGEARGGGRRIHEEAGPGR
jgi:hypothetical protein